MSCSVQNARFESFVTQGEMEVDTVLVPIVKRKGKRKPVINKNEGIKVEGTVPAPAQSTNNNTKTNDEDMESVITASSDVTEVKKKKKKKWKSLSLSDTGFKISLFPRPTHSDKFDPEEEEKILNKIENEIYEHEELLLKHEKLDKNAREIVAGTTKRTDLFTRRDRDRKIQKAGKQVKDKCCRSVRNNDGRKKLYIHHRLYKLINMEEKRLSCHLPSAKSYDGRILFINNKSTNETRSKLKSCAAGSTKTGPVQNLRHTLHATNAPTDIDTQLVNLLVTLQHRDLTPEDYETLLRLDESVAPKTINKSTLVNFKTDIVTAETSGDICAVCMDAYEVGENRKFLPCNHVFHVKCIDMWLENSSQNCPVDGLPVGR